MLQFRVRIDDLGCLRHQICVLPTMELDATVHPQIVVEETADVTNAIPKRHGADIIEGKREDVRAHGASTGLHRALGADPERRACA